MAVPVSALTVNGVQHRCSDKAAIASLLSTHQDVAGDGCMSEKE